MIYTTESIKNRIFIVGSNGMLGQRMVSFYSSRKNIELLGCSIEPDAITNNYEYISIDVRGCRIVGATAYSGR